MRQRLFLAGAFFLLLCITGPSEAGPWLHRHMYVHPMAARPMAMAQPLSLGTVVSGIHAAVDVAQLLSGFLGQVQKPGQEAIKIDPAIKTQANNLQTQTGENVDALNALTKRINEKGDKSSFPANLQKGGFEAIGSTTGGTSSDGTKKGPSGLGTDKGGP